jgi:hypothetical protein
MSEYGKIHTDGSRSGGQPLDDSIEAKALELINEVRRERGGTSYTEYTRLRRNHDDANEALCRAIEQHEAFKQEVSDAAEEYNEAAAPMGWEGFDRFIIHKPKRDPLVEVIKAMQAEPTTYVTTEVYANRINAALDALGFEIREKGQ